jgi:5-methylcytosine-specific restriction endonuclease McrA
VGLLH